MHYDKIFKSEDYEWVLFIHGLGGSSSTWKYQLEDFKEYNIICVDLQGHGKSEFTVKDYYKPQRHAAENIHDILVNEGIDYIHIVSLSLGTIVALEYADKYFNTVKSMTLAGSVINLDYKLKSLLSVVQVLKYILPVDILYPVFAKLIMPLENHKKSREIFINESKKMTKQAFKSWVSALAVTNKTLHDYVKNIVKHRLPVLFVTGKEDHFFISGIIRLHEHCKKLRLSLINKCGHACSIEKKHEFNGIVLDFIKEHNISFMYRRYIELNRI